MANLAQLLSDQAAKQPEHPAIVAGDRVVSYAEFDDAAARVAAFLFGRGFQAGHRAGVMLRAGGTVVPMNPLLKSREVEYYLSDSGAGLLFAATDSPGEPAAGAPRCATCGFAWSPRTVPTCQPARWARSRSAGRT